VISVVVKVNKGKLSRENAVALSASVCPIPYWDDENLGNSWGQSTFLGEILGHEPHCLGVALTSMKSEILGGNLRNLVEEHISCGALDSKGMQLEFSVFQLLFTFFSAGGLFFVMARWLAVKCLNP